MEPSTNINNPPDRELSLMDMPDHIIDKIFTTVYDQQILAMATFNKRLRKIALNHAKNEASDHDHEHWVSTVMELDHIAGLKAIMEGGAAKFLYYECEFSLLQSRSLRALSRCAPPPLRVPDRRSVSLANTRLTWAAIENSKEFIQTLVPYLIENPYNPEDENDVFYGWTEHEWAHNSLLMLVIARGWSDVAMDLIDRRVGTSTYWTSYEEPVKATPLHVAADVGMLDVAQALIDEGFPVNYTTRLIGYNRYDELQNRSWLPIHHAIYNGHVEMVELLLNNGAELEVDSSSQQGKTVAVLASETPAMIDCLVRHATATKPASEVQQYVLLLLRAAVTNASENNDKASLYYILNEHVDYLKDFSDPKDEELVLIYAAIFNHTATIKRFLDGDFNATKDSLGAKLLGVVALSGNTELIELMLDGGVDVNARDAERKTPLHSAVTLVRLQSIKLLLERGADASAKDNEDNTPLDSLFKDYEAHLETDKLPIEELERMKEEFKPAVKALTSHGAVLDDNGRMMITELIDKARRLKLEREKPTSFRRAIRDCRVS